MVFLPKERASRLACEQALERAVKVEGQVLLGWRDVPVDREMPMSPTVRQKEPVIRQIFIGRGADLIVPDALERKLYVIRKTASSAIQRLQLTHSHEYYVPSMSCRTVIYKGLLLADQVGQYYRDLADPRATSALALVHQRFSTNTFPEWPLAHPYRMVAHNGEINTVKGNFNWMRAREGVMKSPVLGDDLNKLYPISFEDQSDTATFDNALELLTMAGYPLAHAAMMMIPEAWEQHSTMDERRRAFYEYHAAMLEPWDGPAAMVFTDGRQIGATLDRNGLRPARYIVTDDDLVVMASESGVLPIPQNKIVKKWRLQPGRMFLIDFEQGRIVEDEELKNQFASAKPYRQWIESVRIKLDDVPPCDRAGGVRRIAARPPAGLRLHAGGSQVPAQPDGAGRRGRHRLDGQRLAAGGAVGQEQAALQLFQAAVRAGHESADRPDPRKHRDVAGLVHRAEAEPARHQCGQSADAARGRAAGARLRGDGAAAQHRAVFERQVQELPARHHLSARVGQRGRRSQARVAVRRGDRRHPGRPQHPGDHRPAAGPRPCRDSGAAGLSAVHQHLVRVGLRTTTGLVVETGSAREVHHFAVLAGYGAEAVHPYLAMETLAHLHKDLSGALSADKAIYNYVKAIGKGLSKIMSKMGVSTYMSYCGAQLFEAIGLEKALVEKYFRGTASQIGGLDIFDVAEEAIRMHRAAFGDDPVLANMLDAGGEYAWRVRGEEHMWTPDAIAKLQHSARANRFDTYKEYAQIINDQSRRHMTLRGLFEFRIDPAKAIPLTEVEPATEIVKRFATGAMSLGSISTEAHATLAVAMNRIGGKSNTGEGGEDPARYRNELKGIPIAAGTKVSDVVGDKVIVADYELQAGDSLRSKIKQVASGRFGVTTEYLVERRPDPDQDGAGRQAGRGRPAAGRQGVRVHRLPALFGARRRPDLAAAAPRHLFDRGSGAADPRPEECQPPRRHQRQAGQRGRRRHDCRRCRQGQGRPCGDRRP